MRQSRRGGSANVPLFRKTVFEFAPTISGPARLAVVPCPRHGRFIAPEPSRRGRGSVVEPESTSAGRRGAQVQRVAQPAGR